MPSATLREPLTPIVCAHSCYAIALKQDRSFGKFAPYGCEHVVPPEPRMHICFVHAVAG